MKWQKKCGIKLKMKQKEPISISLVDTWEEGNVKNDRV